MPPLSLWAARSYLEPMLAALNFQNPLFWAVFIGWVMSVVLHEFAHGIVAYWGGDYTIRERGGLTLNPFQYVDPVMSIGLPILFMLMGGIPLPGGATYVRRDLLRNRGWDCAVSAAGPASNFLIFLALALPLQRWAGWVDPLASVEQWTPQQLFMGALAFLQLFAVILNLLPVPPLDGFQMLSPFLPRDLVQKLVAPPTGMILMIGFFLLIRSEAFMTFAINVMMQVTRRLNIDFFSLLEAARTVLYR